MTFPTMTPDLLSKLCATHKPAVIETAKGAAILTGPARLSFSQVVEPKANDNGTLLFGAALIIPPDADVSPIQREIMKAAVAVHGDKAAAVLGAGQLHACLKPQGKKLKKTGERYDGFSETGFYIDCKSKFGPLLKTSTGELVLDPDIATDASKKLAMTMFYSGAWVLGQFSISYKPAAKATHKPSIMASVSVLRFLAHDTQFKGEGKKDHMADVAVHGAPTAPATAGGAVNWNAL